ncbi:Sporulation lipoprotein YhcN/YlaJ (Spore_YhcN_YlaJ) [Mycobacteroides abscessus subsp. abscessus]|nr:Sporulation lipoprotein YhcN/YlaJ (Spore_YhcN_YlaJ) [Mycobacteroides abscessus subsp. abscessus]
MKKSHTLTLITALTALLTSCNSDATQHSGMSLIQKSDPDPIILDEKTEKDHKLVASIKKDVAKFDELYDVAVIKGEEEILVAYKVKHMQRFHMVKIEGEINKMLEEKYPKENFIVSSDYKIFLEAVELNDKMKNPDFSEEDAKKNLEEIIKLKKELT